VGIGGELLGFGRRIGVRRKLGIFVCFVGGGGALFPRASREHSARAAPPGHGQAGKPPHLTSPHRLASRRELVESGGVGLGK
jgi:hypothetical protein